MGARSPSEPKKRREHGGDGISWDKTNKCYQGTISLGVDGAGKRRRRTVRGKTKSQVKDKLDELHEEIKAGIQTPATYTVQQCVVEWLDSLELDPHTVATYRGEAEKWIYPPGPASRRFWSASIRAKTTLDRRRFRARMAIIDGIPPALRAS